MLNVQVDKDHYSLENYVDILRWGSYYNQVLEVIRTVRGGSSKVLIIGKGDGIVGTIIDQVYKIKTKSFDFDVLLEPDIVGDVCNISDFVKEKYDVIVCCEVLEHIPFEFFDSTIEQISTICSGTLILSLPVRGILFSLSFKIPKCRRHVVNVTIPRFYEKNVPWNGQHYWEVGTKKKGIRNINSILAKYFGIERSYYLKENPGHYFWILKEKA